ncbi:MAG TPA: histidine kinase [Saprospiraceae bacterium]|nr:histidine kinase [Saprospiraceae bacterium]
MQSKRILRHLLFWAVFFCTSLFNELSFSSSFVSDPDWGTFSKVTFSQALIYVVKILVVYYCIYGIIPRWSANQSVMANTPLHKQGKSSLKYFLEFIIALLVGTLLIRLIVQYIVWPHIFGNEIRDLTFTSLLARYIYSLFDLIPITLAAVAIKLVQLRISALKQETKLVHEKVKSELQYLKAQTNPHFLFNTLNGIYALSRKQDAHTPAAIMNLSKILRYMLYETSQKTNPIRDELALITDYIALQKLRFQDHLEITFIKEIDDENAGISPLLLLPLVENAFKHSNGLETHIKVHVHVEAGTLMFSISNTLSEHPESDPIIKDGIGLSNIKRQLAILYKDYTFSATKHENDFVVKLRIALHSYAYV